MKWFYMEIFVFTFSYSLKFWTKQSESLSLWCISNILLVYGLHTHKKTCHIITLRKYCCYFTKKNVTKDTQTSISLHIFMNVSLHLELKSRDIHFHLLNENKDKYFPPDYYSRKCSCYVTNPAYVLHVCYSPITMIMFIN